MNNLKTKKSDMPYVKSFAALMASTLLAVTSAFAQSALTSPEKITRMAEDETAKTFNQDYKDKIRKEALEKFPDIKVGDRITVPIRFGAGFADKTGILRAVGDDAIMVNIGMAGDKKILKLDLHPDLRAAIEGENPERRTVHMMKNYTQARANYKKSILDRLYHENGYVYDGEHSRWTPKIKDSTPVPDKSEVAPDGNSSSNPVESPTPRS